MRDEGLFRLEGKSNEPPLSVDFEEEELQTS